MYAQNANPAALVPLPLQYADYCEWEAENLTPQSMKLHLAYWQQKLAGADFVSGGPDGPAATRSPDDERRHGTAAAFA